MQYRSDFNYHRSWPSFLEFRTENGLGQRNNKNNLQY